MKIYKSTFNIEEVIMFRKQTFRSADNNDLY